MYIPIGFTSSVPIMMWFMFLTNPLTTTISDVHDDETDKRTHHEKMERAADLPVARQLRIP